jgi:hypothetical protein
MDSVTVSIRLLNKHAWKIKNQSRAANFFTVQLREYSAAVYLKRLTSPI